MHIGGLVVRCKPPSLVRLLRSLDRFQGLEVHHRDATVGVLVVVHESDTVSELERVMREIQSLPEVVSAELACCHVVEGEG